MRSHARYFLLLAAFFVVLSTGVGGQSSEPTAAKTEATATQNPALQPAPSISTAEMTTREEPTTFKVKVTLALVPVIVRDSKGNAVGNLRQADFQLFDRGKPQTIRHFSVETAETRAAKATSLETGGEKEAGVKAPVIPQRFIAYVFDDLHMQFAEISQARAAADRQLSSLGPADHAALYTTSGRHMVEFTDDVAKLHDALFRITPQSRSTGAIQCPDWGYYLADRIEKELGSSSSLAVQEGVDQMRQCPEFRPPRIITLADIRMVAMRIISISGIETKASLELVRNVVGTMSALRPPAD